MREVVAQAAQYCTGSGCERVVSEKGFWAIIAAMGAFFVALMIVCLVALGFWLWMLIDSIRKTEADYQKVGAERSIWLILMIISLPLSFAPIMAIVYYFVIYRPFKETEKRPAKK